MRLLREAERNVNACGDSMVAMGYWIESHTLGCRDEGGDSDLWAAHWEFWEKYSNDGVSLLIGDPASGAFVSITPQRDRKATMGAEMLIELGRRVKQTIPLKKAQKLATKVLRAIEGHIQVALIAGSVRRERPQVGDVEMVVMPKDGDLEGLLLHLKKLGFEGGERIQRTIVDGVPVELYIAHKVDEIGAMLMWYTGDYVFNVAMNSIAKRMGYTRNQYGIWSGDTPALQSPDEREFFDFLGVSWHDPEERSFKDRPKKGKKRATLGAEMLIELGGIKRKAGYIHLELFSPRQDGSGDWVLRVERIDPFGGEPYVQDFPFRYAYEAKRWYDSIVGDEDLDALIRSRSG